MKSAVSLVVSLALAGGSSSVALAHRKPDCPPAGTTVVIHTVPQRYVIAEPTVVVQQPAPVIVQQPAPVVVQQPAPVVVQQPPQVVYTSPPPVVVYEAPMYRCAPPPRYHSHSSFGLSIRIGDSWGHGHRGYHGGHHYRHHGHHGHGYRRGCR